MIIWGQNPLTFIYSTTVLQCIWYYITKLKLFLLFMQSHIMFVFNLLILLNNYFSSCQVFRSKNKGGLTNLLSTCPKRVIKPSSYWVCYLYNVDTLKLCCNYRVYWYGVSKKIIIIFVLCYLFTLWLIKL